MHAEVTDRTRSIYFFKYTLAGVIQDFPPPWHGIKSSFVSRLCLVLYMVQWYFSTWITHECKTNISVNALKGISIDRMFGKFMMCNILIFKDFTIQIKSIHFKYEDDSIFSNDNKYLFKAWNKYPTSKMPCLANAI